jgi:hypothetical protein
MQTCLAMKHLCFELAAQTEILLTHFVQDKMSYRCFPPELNERTHLLLKRAEGANDDYNSNDTRNLTMQSQQSEKPLQLPPATLPSALCCSWHGSNNTRNLTMQSQQSEKPLQLPPATPFLLVLLVAWQLFCCW